MKTTLILVLLVGSLTVACGPVPEEDPAVVEVTVEPTPVEVNVEPTPVEVYTDEKCQADLAAADEEIDLLEEEIRILRTILDGCFCN